MLVAVPEPAEQQKIAKCLGTLDELIIAESQKLDALKAHKKGLIQQLFPRKGESVPDLRFPEFRGAPGWVASQGGDLFLNRKEHGEAGLPIYSVTMNDGMVPRASFDRDFYDIQRPAGNKKVRRGDICYNMMRMWQGAQGVAPEDCMVSPAYVVLAPRENVCAEFFAHYFRLPQSLDLLTATSRGLTKDRLRLYYDDFSRMRMCVPGIAEQQRIAACLESLDYSFAAQCARLESLKAHKQGLMQRLFPSTAEVDG
jgi:type I restriction enzyme S subunit